MKGTFKKALVFLLVGLGVGALVLGLKPRPFSTTAPVSEISVKVTEIQQLEQSKWIAPRDAVVKTSTSAESYVLRLKHLRSESVLVRVVNETGDGILLHSDKLNPGDLLVMEPASIQSPQAVAPTEGVDDKRLIQLTLEAGMAAAMAEDLDESVRFVSYAGSGQTKYLIS